MSGIFVSTTMVADKRMGEDRRKAVLGKTRRRFDEGAKGRRPAENPPLATVNTYPILIPRYSSTLLGEYKLREIK